MVTPHINAKNEDIAKIVIMSGDPLRVKFFADKFLKDKKLVNDVRGMLAYTGYIDGIRVTLMGHGMGLSSIGIYAYELYKFYDVDFIIRAGTSGAYTEDINIYDLVIAKTAFSESNYGLGFNYDKKTIDLDPKILKLTEEVAQKTGKKVNFSTINSSMWFYSENPAFDYKNYLSKGLKASEMESYALYIIAKTLNKEALTVLTITDNLATKEAIPAEKREQNLSEMFEFIIELVKQKVKNEE